MAFLLLPLHHLTIIEAYAQSREIDTYASCNSCIDYNLPYLELLAVEPECGLCCTRYPNLTHTIMHCRITAGCSCDRSS